MTDPTSKLSRRRGAGKSVVGPGLDAPALASPSAADPAGSESKDDTMTTTFDHVTDAAQDQAQTVAADFAGRAKGAMDKGTQMVEELGSFTKGNVEAIVESTGIYARGLESFGQHAAAFGRKSFEDATAAMKAMAAAKSPTELFKVQSDYTRQMFDAMVAETSRSTEKMVKLVGEAVQPISTRVSLAAEKVKLAA